MGTLVTREAASTLVPSYLADDEKGLHVPEYTLLTGSTGLLGRYLLRDLLLAEKKLVVVVRPGNDQTVQYRIETILQHWEHESGKALSRPIYMAGDVTEPLLGLDAPAIDWVTEHCTAIIHSAASLTFLTEGDGEPWRTNLDGTRHVLELCRATNIHELHYISTAYVCGMREEVIYETELDCGQTFRNDYEQSKLQAEKLVRGDEFITNLTVYRPAVIAGDSQSGYTNTYHGLFMYLKIMSILARSVEPDSDGVRRTEIQLHLNGDEQRNVIPVDWAAAVISHIFCTPTAHGQTYHLAPQVRMTPRDMIAAGYSYFNSTGVEFIGPTAAVQSDGSDMKRHAYDNSTLYRDYEYSDPIFDTTNLEKYAAHLPCPVIDESMLHRFMSFGEQDRWGKRRPRALKPWFDVAEFLTSAVVESLGGDSRWQMLGLDLIGPGGGQWTLALSDDRLVAAEPGICEACEEVFTLPTQVFAAIAQRNISTNPRALLTAIC
jgi:thioester reductase-like protein